MSSIKNLEIKQRLKNLKESIRINELKSQNTSRDSRNEKDGNSSDSEDSLPPLTYFYLLPPPFDLNLLPNVVLPEINEPKLEMREEISKIENFSMEEHENKKTVMTIN